MSEYPKLIGLTGYAGSGKDLVAALLKMVGYTRFGFADAVREEVSKSFEDYYAIPQFPDHILACWLSCATLGKDVLYEKPMYGPARQLLQWWGTEYRRAEDHAYWINKCHKAIQASIGPKPVVISDIRFLNEAAWIERWDGIVWRIERPGLKSDGHRSEDECNMIRADYTIHNDGDLQHLANQVLTALEVFRDGSETSKSASD
jgi:hypothetical protein